ncbi:MAG: HlyD family secretion protein [Tannerellaceae bacterium]|jgi:membrane fusion protein (multidrug efflux system)|nr:HlyD family secretion protein [Tannerellaceae bacterium]
MNKRKRKIVADVVVAVFILSGAAWIASLFIHLGGEYTNNAQIRGDIVPVSSRVQGFIKKVYFDEFQQVKKGDTLVVIEDSEFRLRLAQAEADYQNAQAGKSAMGATVSVARSNVSAADAGIREVEVLLENARAEYVRYGNLLSGGAVTRQQYDAVRTQYEALKAKLETMRRQERSTQLAKDEQIQRLGQNEALIELYSAALDLARLNLSYTIILAPCDGFVSRKTVQEGELVQPGKPLVAIVDSRQKWVIANYRETQMKRIRPGAKARIRVDAFPDVEFEGIVTAIAGATGAQFSVASPDNSAGNFVKVEQRIPVKIVFAESEASVATRSLAAGMNVECTVNY